MKGLWGVLPEVEDHVWIGEVGGWVPLLTMKEVWELYWVIDEEDWSIVANHIVVALLCVELNGEATWISHSISSTSLTSDSGESKEKWGLLANLVQEFSLGEHGDILSYLKDTMCTRSLGVHNTLWDSLSIEVSKLINKGEVLQDNWSLGSSGH